MEFKIKTPQQALKAIKDIPDDQWCVGDFAQVGKCCFFGHIMRLEKDLPMPSEEFNQIDYNDLGGHILRKLSPSLSEVNNGDYDEFQQETPKARVIAALKQIIEEQS